MDMLARPRGWRSGAGLWLLACQVIALFGAMLALCGSVGVSVAFVLAVLALLVIASNAKHAMLGEPLVFSDLALIASIFRHPQFYLSAVAPWQRVAGAVVALALLFVIAWLAVADLAPHAAGLATMLGALALLAVSVRVSLRHLAREPRNEADVRCLGLTPTVMLYWRRWQQSRDPEPCPSVMRRSPHAAPEQVVIIQCESFADPAALFGDPALALAGLEAARGHAWQYGNLHVSGFGAYTMRTEYAVLFGREEHELGFRRYDPFLTALSEASYALPARLGPRWRSLFVHPHDMRFYGRDAIMPAAGFGELVGEDRFVPPAPGEGRYVTDTAMADVILASARAAQEPSLLYAVTIENHGPWAPDRTSETGDLPGDLTASYLRLVRNSDAMLARLIAGLADLGRPAMLVFFGDHRPSIPGATNPAGDRHTPYVIMRFDTEGRAMLGEKRCIDLTPAGLHHVVLDLVLGEPA
ncbi:Capsular polysaccharide biosynthesis protein WcbQ [Novosphingobium sp. 9U]|nr:Capsular polysaccharide biosynthesis protein WcbQ [Novosphingobium sp. 9U]